MRRASQQELFTAADLARFCQVDLKTIHNWAERGEIRHFRTPGRHLRVHRLDALDFLRRYGYAVPVELMKERPRVTLIESDVTTASNIKRVLGKRFDITAHEDAIDALLAIGNHAPDAVVIDLDTHALNALHCIERLGSHPATQHVRVIACSRERELKPNALQRGASAFVDKAELSTMKPVLEALMGIGRA